jgi:hypothetical protein
MRRLETIQISDHFYRAIYFLNTCRQAGDLEGYNWNLLASVYSSRAIVEIVFHSFQKGYLSQDPEKFMEGARANVRRFKLVETIRVQDFHRGPVTFNPNAMSFVGPAKGKSSSQRGSLVGLSFAPDTGKMVEHKLRNASIKYDRPLTINGLCAQDHDCDEMVQIDIAVEEYLIDLKCYLSSIHNSFAESLSVFFTDKEQFKPPV